MLKAKDGSFRTVEITGTNLLQEPGIHAMVSILRDVTQRTVAEERLRERESQLAHVARLSTMGEMVAFIELWKLDSTEYPMREMMEAGAITAAAAALVAVGAMEDEARRAAPVPRGSTVPLRRRRKGRSRTG